MRRPACRVRAAAFLITHLSKLAAYGASDLLSLHVIQLGLALMPAIRAGAWLGKITGTRMSTRAFALVVEAGLFVTAILLLVGI